MNKYTELLINEIQLANELSSILEDESAALANNQIEMLFELARQKDSIVQRFNLLEEEKKLSDANLNDEEIKKLQHELMTIVQQCAKQNMINGKTIMLSQKRTSQQLSLLLGEQNYLSLYSAEGKSQNNLLSR